MISVAEEKEHEEEEEEELEKLDLSDTLAPAVVMREVGNINDLPEELLLEIFLCLPPTTVLEVCYIISSRNKFFQISYHRNSFRYKCHNLHTKLFQFSLSPIPHCHNCINAAMLPEKQTNVKSKQRIVAKKKAV